MTTRSSVVNPNRDWRTLPRNRVTGEFKHTTRLFLFFEKKKSISTFCTGENTQMFCPVHKRPFSQQTF